MTVLERVLDRESTVYVACGVTLALGLVFIFVRAPHPWGSEGFDHYHQLALTVASGAPFPTMDVPWGYAYFLAAFYRAFGDHPSIPLTVQAALNALVPLLVFQLASHWVPKRTAILAALLAGLLSFNTVYASTQSSDAVCTVTFLAALLAFVRATASGRLALYALSGILLGVAPQFRPNLILVPATLAAYMLLSRSVVGARLTGAAALLASAGLALAPWTVRNYRLSHSIIPASVHSGVQLWYGSLQVGPYLHSRAHNPRAVFEDGAFDYTSLDHVPLIITAQLAPCEHEISPQTALVYWTDRNAARVTVPGTWQGHVATYEAPIVEAPGVFYSYLTARWPDGSVAFVPITAPDIPRVFFVSHDHLGDLDRAGDLLDVFDLIRMVRRAAWGEPLPWEDRLAAAGFGRHPLQPAIDSLIPRFGESLSPGASRVKNLVVDSDRAVLTLGDNSTITVPRSWRGRLTDVDFSGGLAAALIPATLPFRAPGGGERTIATTRPCGGLDAFEINRVFYRREPHLLRRYTALAIDNIERAPIQFAIATIFRIGRLFVVWGSDDAATMQQFSGGRWVTRVATLASLTFVIAFAAGALIAWRAQYPIGLPLLLVAYVPATIAPMLTNMRYTVTVQPLMFVFVAVAVIRLSERARLPAAPRAEPDRADTRTAHRL